MKQMESLLIWKGKSDTWVHSNRRQLLKQHLSSGRTTPPLDAVLLPVCAGWDTFVQNVREVPPDETFLFINSFFSLFSTGLFASWITSTSKLIMTGQLFHGGPSRISSHFLDSFWQPSLAPRRSGAATSHSWNVSIWRGGVWLSWGCGELVALNVSWQRLRRGEKVLRSHRGLLWAINAHGFVWTKWCVIHPAESSSSLVFTPSHRHGFPGNFLWQQNLISVFVCVCVQLGDLERDDTETQETASWQMFTILACQLNHCCILGNVVWLVCTHRWVALISVPLNFGAVSFNMITSSRWTRLMFKSTNRSVGIHEY